MSEDKTLRALPDEVKRQIQNEATVEAVNMWRKRNDEPPLTVEEIEEIMAR